MESGTGRAGAVARTSDFGRVDLISRTLAANRLGVWAVVFFVLAAAAPFTVVAGVITTGYAVTGIVGIPLAFVVVGVVLAVFSVGYVAMARHVANAGAFYAYVARGLGRPLGVGAAWVALLAYNALQVGLYGAIGAAAGPLLAAWLGVDVPWWLVALGAWALVAVLGLLRVDLNGTVLAVLLLAEVAVIVVYDVVFIGHPADGAVTFDTLDVSNLAGPGFGALLALALLGFVGFESAVVYAEESRDPRRTVRRATYVSVALIAVMYAGSAWAMSVAAGPDRIVATSQELGPETIFTLAGVHLGQWAVDVGHALFLTSLLAALIAFHATWARYAFALGREQVLPRWFAATRRRSGAPKVGSLVQSAIGLAVIVVYAANGWDPLVHLFFWLGTGGGYGILLLLTLTGFAVITFFARTATAESWWTRLVAPLLAVAGLVLITTMASIQFGTLLGVEPHAPVRWLVPVGYAVTAVLGVGWALVLRATRPEVYQRIGLGAKAATANVGLPAAGEGGLGGWDSERTAPQDVIR